MRQVTSNSISAPVTQFLLCPQTKFIFDQFPKARTVQVRKEGFLGIMVIYGKHVEVGNGIFVSDLREGSNAEAVSWYCYC